MRGTKFIFTILLLLGVKLLFAQTKAELDSIHHLYLVSKTDTSRILTLTEWSRTIYNANPDSSLLLANKALELSKKLNYTRGMGRSERAIAYYMVLNGKASSGEELLKKAFIHARQINDNYCIGLIHITYGIQFYLKAKLNAAIQHFEISLAIFTKSKNTAELGKVYNNLGLMYKEKGEFAKAISYFNKGISTCQKTHDLNTLTLIYNNLGLIEMAKGDCSKSLEYYFSSLKTLEKNSNKRMLSATYNNIGNTYRYLGQVDKAVEFLKKSLKVSGEIGSKTAIGLVNENIGLIYYSAKPPKFIEAQNYFLKSKRCFQEAGEPSSIIQASTYLVITHVALKQFPAALKELKAGFELSKKIESNERKADLYEAAAEYYYATASYQEALKCARIGTELSKKAQISSILIDNLEQNYLAAEKLGLYNEAFLRLKDYTTLYKQIQDQNEKKNYFLKEFKFKEEKLQFEQRKKELELKRDEDQRHWIWVGGLIGVVFLVSLLLLISKNLKKQKEFNKILREMNDTKDKLFSIISHDLKSPFNSILGFSELLNESIGELEEDELKKITASIYKSSRSTYDLLEQLLDWAALQSKKIEYTPENINLKTIIVENLNVVSSFAEQKQIQITDNTSDSQLVFADPNMLNTVIRNLLTNAIKFTYNEGKIEISSFIKHNMLFISIKDNGQGIAAQKLETLFNLNVHNSTKGTNNESGTGLGLILCKEFIERNKGKLTIESEEGKGSNFIISLPLVNLA